MKAATTWLTVQVDEDEGHLRVAQGVDTSEWFDFHRANSTEMADLVRKATAQLLERLGGYPEGSV